MKHEFDAEVVFGICGAECACAARRFHEGGRMHEQRRNQGRDLKGETKAVISKEKPRP
jgi:hypothetical protein